jgi:hypothetical protein
MEPSTIGATRTSTMNDCRCHERGGRAMPFPHLHGPQSSIENAEAQAAIRRKASPPITAKRAASSLNGCASRDIIGLSSFPWCIALEVFVSVSPTPRQCGFAAALHAPGATLTLRKGGARKCRARHLRGRAGMGLVTCRLYEADRYCRPKRDKREVEACLG